jgi:hypothetical protein
MIPHLYLISSSAFLPYLESQYKLRLTSPDILLAPEDVPQLTLPFTKSIHSFLKTPPLKDPFKTIIIPSAERLTLTAQNSLLKLLEEPPAYAVFYLSVTHRQQLLATIESRCQIIPILSDPITIAPISTELKSLLASLQSAKPGARLLLTEKFTSNRLQAISFCQALLVIGHLSLLQKPTPQTASRIRKIALCLLDLQANVNPHLAIEHLFLHWDES